MTKIVAFAHFKQSGKSTSCEFLENYLKKIKIKKEDLFSKDFEGNPWVSIEHPTVKIYSFADKLKQFCMEVLGLTKEQCYGSDEQKNSLTHLKWEDMPGITIDEEFHYQQSEWFDYNPDTLKLHKPGQMTAREVLQHFGTGICRRIVPNCWIDATIKQIQKDELDFAFIADCRFRNEADAVRTAGGKVIGFTRRPFSEDQHASEIDLIGYTFDALIDNANMTVEEKNNAVLNTIKKWGWV